MKEYFDIKIDLLEEKNKERFIAAKDNINIALLASEKAIGKAELANDKRFDSVNEFRGSLSDQTKNFLPRIEYQVQHATLTEKLDAFGIRLQVIETRLLTQGEGLSRTGAVLLGTIALASTLVALASFVYNVIRH